MQQEELFREFKQLNDSILRLLNRLGNRPRPKCAAISTQTSHHQLPQYNHLASLRKNEPQTSSNSTCLYDSSAPLQKTGVKQQYKREVNPFNFQQGKHYPPSPYYSSPRRQNSKFQPPADATSRFESDGKSESKRQMGNKWQHYLGSRTDRYNSIDHSIKHTSPQQRIPIGLNNIQRQVLRPAQCRFQDYECSQKKFQQKNAYHRTMAPSPGRMERAFPYYY